MNFSWSSFFIGLIVGLAIAYLTYHFLYKPFVLNEAQWGSFPFSAKSEWLNDGRDMKLLEDFTYIDPNQKVWTAPKNSIVNGASIPRAFWTIVGGPYEGKYRNASIVHDVACELKNERSVDVHRMFYNACRCNGVPEKQAKILYLAVYHFGPSWELEVVQELRVISDERGERQIPVTKTIPRVLMMANENQPDVEKLKKIIETSNPSLEEIERLDPTAP